MKLLNAIAALFVLTFFCGCGASSVISSVSASGSGGNLNLAYDKIAAVMNSNNFSVAGDTTNYSMIIADYKTPWSYELMGDGENFHKKIITLGMEIKVNLSANQGDGYTMIVTPFYWQAEDLSDFDKKLDKVADRVNASLKKDALGKNDAVSTFPNAFALKYYKEDDRESGTLTPEDTKIYKKMIVLFTKIMDEVSTQLKISKDKLHIEIKDI